MTDKEKTANQDKKKKLTKLKTMTEEFLLGTTFL